MYLFCFYRFSRNCEGVDNTGLKVGIAESVAQAMAETEYSDEVYDKVEAWKVNTELFVAKQNQ